MARRTARSPVTETPVAHASPAASQGTAAPAAGHNSAYTDEQLIAENHQIEAWIKQATEKLNDWAKPHKERLKEIENDLFARLNERGSSSTSTDAGTAYISTLMNTKVEDATKLFDFLADHWDEYGADIQINLSKDAVKRFMEASSGHVPPGMSISHFSRINIKRS